MKRASFGKAFEEEVFRALRAKFACLVHSSETLDRIHKIDGEIRRIGRRRLRKVVQIQVTHRVDHFAKLDAYLATRWLNADIVSLYVEVRRGASALETAEHLVWAAEETQAMTPYRDLPIFGLRVDDDATFFDPYERLRALDKERKSPGRLAALMQGVAYKFDEDGFWIVDGSGDTYRAHYIDAFEPGFRGKLRNGVGRIPVLFHRIAEHRASDVRPAPPERQRP